MPPAIVTGSSGFIGTHLCAALSERYPADSHWGIDMEPPAGPVSYRHLGIDIRRLDLLQRISEETGQQRTVFHLAAAAEVLTPWSEVPRLLSSNLQGTYNVLDALNPRRIIFASSSSVYGDRGLRPADPRSDILQPLCLYAGSKMSGEMLVRDWVRETGNAAVNFRFGNVVGAGCRGLIPYLTGHALRYPDGGVPARLRGNGRLVRDYVPVGYVVNVLIAAARLELQVHSLLTFNLGSGAGMTNREVAEIVQQVASDSGLRLDIRFDDPPGAGEANEVVLDMEETVKLVGIAPPDSDAVRSVIRETAQQALKSVHGAAFSTSG